MWCVGFNWVIKGPVIKGADSLPTPPRALMMPSGVPPFFPYRFTVTTIVTNKKDRHYETSEQMTFVVTSI